MSAPVPVTQDAPRHNAARLVFVLWGFMPSVSEKQRKAMRAAAAGESTIGIPQSVGREFVEADRKKAENKRLADKQRRKQAKKRS